MLYIGYILFLLMGGTFALIGAGGSILSIPILVYFIGLNPILATSYSFYVVFLIAFLGAIRYVKKSLINFKDVLYFAAPSSLGVIIARYYIMPQIPEEIFGLVEKADLFIFIFSFFMILNTIITFKSINKEENGLKISFIKATVSASCIGVIVGILGAGGGFLIIPALHNFLKIDFKKTVGTSLSVVSINSFIAILIDASNFNLDFVILLPILMFALLGMIIGFTVESKIKSGNLKKFFAIFTFFIAIAMLVKTFI